MSKCAREAPRHLLAARANTRLASSHARVNEARLHFHSDEISANMFGWSKVMMTLVTIDVVVREADGLGPVHSLRVVPPTSAAAGRGVPDAQGGKPDAGAEECLVAMATRDLVFVASIWPSTRIFFKMPRPADAAKPTSAEARAGAVLGGGLLGHAGGACLAWCPMLQAESQAGALRSLVIGWGGAVKSVAVDILGARGARWGGLAGAGSRSPPGSPPPQAAHKPVVGGGTGRGYGAGLPLLVGPGGAGVGHAGGQSSQGAAGLTFGRVGWRRVRDTGILRLEATCCISGFVASLHWLSARVVAVFVCGAAGGGVMLVDSGSDSGCLCLLQWLPLAPPSSGPWSSGRDGRKEGVGVPGAIPDKKAAQLPAGLEVLAWLVAASSSGADTAAPTYTWLASSTEEVLIMWRCGEGWSGWDGWGGGAGVVRVSLKRWEMQVQELAEDGRIGAAALFAAAVSRGVAPAYSNTGGGIGGMSGIRGFIQDLALSFCHGDLPAARSTGGARAEKKEMGSIETGRGREQAVVELTGLLKGLLLIGADDFALTVVRREMAASSHVGADIYLEAVEMLLNKGVFARLGFSLPTEIFQDLLEMLTRRRLVGRAEESILAAEIGCIDFHHVAKLCHQLGLLRATTYLYTQGLADFITPAKKLIISLRHCSAEDTGLTGRGRRQRLATLFEYIHLVLNWNEPSSGSLFGARRGGGRVGDKSLTGDMHDRDTQHSGPEPEPTASEGLGHDSCPGDRPVVDLDFLLSPSAVSPGNDVAPALLSLLFYDGAEAWGRSGGKAGEEGAAGGGKEKQTIVAVDAHDSVCRICRKGLSHLASAVASDRTVFALAIDSIFSSLGQREHLGRHSSAAATAAPAAAISQGGKGAVGFINRQSLCERLLDLALEDDLCGRGGVDAGDVLHTWSGGTGGGLIGVREACGLGLHSRCIILIFVLQVPCVACPTDIRNRHGCCLGSRLPHAQCCPFSPRFASFVLYIQC